MYIMVRNDSMRIAERDLLKLGFTASVVTQSNPGPILQEAYD